MCAASCYIGPRYNGTQLNIGKSFCDYLSTQESQSWMGRSFYDKLTTQKTHHILCSWATMECLFWRKLVIDNNTALHCLVLMALMPLHSYSLIDLGCWHSKQRIRLQYFRNHNNPSSSTLVQVKDCCLMPQAITLSNVFLMSARW